MVATEADPALAPSGIGGSALLSPDFSVLEGAKRDREIPTPERNIPSWARSGTALLDQSLFGGANFLVSVLLARWLDPQEYGAFSVAYAMFLLLAGFHTAILSEPMLVFGAKKYARNLPRYAGILITAHFGLTVTIFLILAGAATLAWWVGHEDLARSLFGLSIATPTVLLLWLVRRVPYVGHRPHLSIAMDACFLGLVVAFMVGLVKLRALSSLTAFGAISISALSSSALLTNMVWPQFRDAGSEITVSGVLRDHRSYGGWNLLGMLGQWLSGQVVIVTLPLVLGLSATAAVSAVANIFRPLNLLIQSAGLVVLPALASIGRDGPEAELMRQEARRFFAILGGGVFVYGLAVTIFSGPILHQLYGGRYDGSGMVVLMLALMYLASVAVQVPTLAIKATGDARPLVRIWLISGVLTAILSIPAARVMGIEGAIGAVLVSYVMASIAAQRKIRALSAQA